MEKFFSKFLTWLVFYCVFDLCWVGAEYVFEGAVHSSLVDVFVCGLLAYLFIEAFSGERKDGDEDGL